MIRTEHLTRHFQLGGTVAALQEVSVIIKEGEYVAITGPSGSGKSTFLNIVGCLDQPTGGRCWLDGEDVSQLSSDALASIRNRKIGFVFQSFNLLERLTAVENVAMPLMYRGIERRERRTIAETALRIVGLGDRGGHLPMQLSGGQQQRVALARALAGSPRLILADEPTGSLDSKSADDLLETFQRLVEYGKTIVVVTHDPRVASRASRAIAFLDGRVQ